MKYNILIDSNDGRFGNQLYPIFVALSFYEHNKDKFESKIYFKTYMYIGYHSFAHFEICIPIFQNVLTNISSCEYNVLK